MAYDQVCSGTKRLFLQYLDRPKEVLDIAALRLKIAEDPALQHLTNKIQSLVFALLSIGKNDYTGKVYGISNCHLAYKAVVHLEADLACRVTEHSMTDGDVRPEHFTFLVSSEVQYTISLKQFRQYFKNFYIFKSQSIFNNDISFPLDRNVQKWKRPLLVDTLAKLSLKVTPQGPRRLVTVDMMKRTLLEHFSRHPEARETVFDGGARTPGRSISEYEYSQVVVKVWLAKDSPRDWCLTDHQLDQLHGRVVLTGIIFSIGKTLPDFHSLNHFGFKINFDDRRLCHNLDTGSNHKTADQLVKEINVAAKKAGNVAKTNKRQRLQ